MIRFWRLEAVPELRDLPKRRRRTLWSEAVSRSSTPRWIVRQLVARVLGAAAVLALLWIKPLWLGLLLGAFAALVVQLVVDGGVIAPRARRWLREHAHELDRYASE